MTVGLEMKHDLYNGFSKNYLNGLKIDWNNNNYHTIYNNLNIYGDNYLRVYLLLSSPIVIYVDGEVDDRCCKEPKKEHC